MKKLLVLAMVLVLAAPLFAEMTIFGEFDYYMVNGFDSDNGASFQDDWDKGEVDFKGTIGDYSQIRIELEDDGNWPGGATGPEGTPSFNYFRVITDWGKLFGLDGIGIKTDIGLNSYETFDNVDFTGFNYENADNFGNPSLRKDFGWKLSLDFVDGLVQPYFAMNFDTVAEESNAGAATPDGEATFLIGSGFDFNAIGLPLWLEAYFWKGPAEDSNKFGIEAMYDLAIGDMNFKVGGYFLNGTQIAFGGAEDDRGSRWGFGVGFEAFGAAINVSAGGEAGEDCWGKDNYSIFSVLGVDAEYFFLDWLGVNAGVAFQFGDYKDALDPGDNAFQSFEAGVVVKPDKGVCYKLGYIYVDEDVAANQGRFFRTLNTNGVTAEKGGLYFVTKIDF